MQINLKAKHVYGNKLFYPACDKAQMFCDLLCRKTLDAYAMKYIRKLGFEIIITGE